MMWINLTPVLLLFVAACQKCCGKAAAKTYLVETANKNGKFDEIIPAHGQSEGKARDYYWVEDNEDDEETYDEEFGIYSDEDEGNTKQSGNETGKITDQAKVD